MINPLNSELYDKLKFLSQVLLPALGTLYFALAGIWGLPSAEEVVGTIIAVDTFLGVILQLSSNAYKNSEERFDGSLVMNETPEGKTYLLALNGDPEELSDKDEIIFKVNQTMGE